MHAATHGTLAFPIIFCICRPTQAGRQQSGQDGSKAGKAYAGLYELNRLKTVQLPEALTEVASSPISLFSLSASDFHCSAPGLPSPSCKENKQQPLYEPPAAAPRTPEACLALPLPFRKQVVAVSLQIQPGVTSLLGRRV